MVLCSIVVYWAASCESLESLRDGFITGIQRATGNEKAWWRCDENQMLSHWVVIVRYRVIATAVIIRLHGDVPSSAWIEGQCWW